MPQAASKLVSAQNEEGLEKRKIDEIEWANFRYALKEPGDAYDKFKANEKYYAVNRSVHAYLKIVLRARGHHKDVLEIACGKTPLTFWIADQINSGLCADISDVAVVEAAEEGRAKGIAGLDKIKFQVLDCEKTGMPDNSFDLMIESGALHHMDLDVIYKEAARILKPNGAFVCAEAIKHNPIIHLYRKLTPHLRTPWEVDHILTRGDVMKGLQYFNTITTKNFHIMTLFAVPFRKTRFFTPLLTVLEKIDAILTRIPGFRWLAWQCVFVLSDPKK